MAWTRARRIHAPGVPAKVEQPASVPAKQIFLERYESSLSLRDARQTAGLTVKDVATARLEDPEFDAACAEIEEQSLDKIEERSLEMARDDPAMARWILERRRPEKYGNRTKMDINVRDVTKLTDEELEAYILQCQGKTRR